MARQQFEDRFRNILEQREIKPSAGSWEKLSGRLDSAEKKPKPIFWWLGIAATLAGGLLIYSLFFNFSTKTGTPEIVDTPSVEIFQEPGNPAQENTLIVSEVEQERLPDVAENPSEEKSKEKLDKPVKSKSVRPVDVNSQIASAATRNAVEENEESIKEVELAEDLRLRTRLEEIIGQVAANEDKDASDAEINALLYKAATEISLEQNQNYLTGSIDAGALLYDVEMELEQSFREKVFDLLKEGYSKARTAVANRSN